MDVGVWVRYLAGRTDFETEKERNTGRRIRWQKIVDLIIS